MRDDFPDLVKRALASRVGNLCSRPDCRALTSGPQDDPAKVLNVGVAAHITAASKEGPRYDRSLSQEDRRAAPNGIWLCQNCAKLVDNDESQFTVSQLRLWKEDAESRARSAIGKTGGWSNTPDAAAYAASPTSLHQLPPPPADFTGRAKELDELLKLVRTGAVAISGMHGMGGIGKTAFALKLAQELVPDYPDAQMYLDLKGVSNDPLSPNDVMAHVIHSYEPTAKVPENETSSEACINPCCTKGARS